jgi:Uncharacterized conserved protein (DUF2358)
MQTTALMEILRQDYQRFPEHQTYGIYADNVYFQDPLTRFRGIDRYRQLIRFIQTWFRETRMELHTIACQGDRIHTRWTLHWRAPLPWQPQMVISGRSELILESTGLIASHIDHWDCSRLHVLKQLILPRSA